jgi:hypothetical protein
MMKVFRTVRTIIKKFQPHLICVKSENRSNSSEKASIKQRWKEYCEDLLS